MTGTTDGRTDFDFFIGKWNVHHRLLRGRLVGSTSWEEFEGTSEAWHMLGGMANIEAVAAERETGHIEGMAVRVFDPQLCVWRIYWAGHLGGPLDTPMVGKFANGRGEFYAQETHEGRHVYSRFIWSEITASSARWEQALSEDGGATWETNWIMEFTRRE